LICVLAALGIVVVLRHFQGDAAENF